MFSLKKLAKVAVPTVLALTLSSQTFAKDAETCDIIGKVAMVAMLKYQNGDSLKENKKFLDEQFSFGGELKEVNVGLLKLVYSGEYAIEKTEEKKKEAVAKFGKEVYEICRNN